MGVMHTPSVPKLLPGFSTLSILDHIQHNNYRKDHLFKFKLWIVPVHLGEHWAMMVILL